MFNVELLWDNILSRDPKKICETLKILRVEDRQNVMTHLHRMAEDHGWHPEQRTSAEFALRAIDNFCSPDKEF